MPPVSGPWGPGPPPATNPHFYHQFAVPEYAITHESSQQDRPFKCDQCPQSFSRNHDLKRHQNTHNPFRQYKCPTCEKYFSRQDALKRHQVLKDCSKKGDSKTSDSTQESQTSDPKERKRIRSEQNEDTKARESPSSTSPKKRKRSERSDDTTERNESSPMSPERRSAT